MTKLGAFYRFIVTMIFVFGLDFLEFVRIFSKEDLIVVPKYVFILSNRNCRNVVHKMVNLVQGYGGVGAYYKL